MSSATVTTVLACSVGDKERPVSSWCHRLVSKHQEPPKLPHPSAPAPGTIGSPQASSLDGGMGPGAWQRSVVRTSQLPTDGP